MNDTAEPVPKLGLADLGVAELPHLEVVVRNAKSEIVANVGAQICALIVSPRNRVLASPAITSKSRRPNRPGWPTSGWPWPGGPAMFIMSRCWTAPAI